MGVTQVLHLPNYYKTLWSALPCLKEPFNCQNYAEDWFYFLSARNDG